MSDEQSEEQKETTLQRRLTLIFFIKKLLAGSTISDVVVACTGSLLEIGEEMGVDIKSIQRNVNEFIDKLEAQRKESAH